MSLKSLSRLILILFCVQLAVSASFASPSLQTPPSIPSTAANIQVTESTDTGIVLDLHFAQPILAVVQKDSVTYTSVSMGPEFSATATPGQPQLPLTARMVALPPGATASITISDAVWQTLAVANPLAPAPRFDFADQTQVQEGAAVIPFVERDAAAYAADAWQPAAPVRLGESSYLRDQALINVEFYPVRYNPVRSEIAWLSQAHVVISFEGGQPSTNVRPDPYFETTLAASVLNYAEARAWRTPTSPRSLPNFVPATGDVRMAVRQNGIYRVTYTDLINLGYNDISNWPVSNFVVSNKGNDVARYISDTNNNGYLDAGEAIYFYGQALDMTYYTLDNIYWLRINSPTAGLAMGTRSAPPAGAQAPPYFKTTVRTKQETWRWSQHMVPWQAWWWDQFQVNYPDGSRTYTFNLPEVATAPYSATVSVRIGGRYSWPEYNPDHHSKVYINNSSTPVINSFWDGRVLIDLAGNLNQSSLINGDNTLRLESIVSDVGRPANARVDWTYFKWVDVTYYRNYKAVNQELEFGQETAGTWRFVLSGLLNPGIQIFDITNPQTPVRITDGVAGVGTFSIQDTTTPSQRFLAVGASAVRTPMSLSSYVAAPINLRSTALQADYIFITHATFSAALQPLVAYRQSQGYHVIVADINWVYDQFNAGILDAEAIHTFLDYAYHSWTAPAPAYTLLVGGSNFNPNGYNPNPYPNGYGPQQPVYVPTIDLIVDPFQGESAADAYFATVSGNDALPDIFMGRLPVSSTADLTAAVNKIINYEVNPERGAWQNDILFVADNTDDAGNFEAVSESIINTYLASPSWDIRKVYYNPALVNPTDPYYNTVDSARAAIRSKWSQGIALSNYVGHAFLDYWGNTVLDQQWTNDDVLTLTNGSRLPFLISLDCLDGYFDYPNKPSLSEKLLTFANGGTVAHFAPSGLGIATGHDYLHRGFYNAIINNHQYQTGPVVMAAKINLYNSSPNYYQDLLYTFGLIGDPATSLVPLCRVTDINCDNRVNIVDIQTVSAHWNYSSGQSGYIGRYDVTNDGAISITDIIATATDYGWSQ